MSTLQLPVTPQVSDRQLPESEAVLMYFYPVHHAAGRGAAFATGT
jgi:hypothetical protein